MLSQLAFPSYLPLVPSLRTYKAAIYSRPRLLLAKPTAPNIAAPEDEDEDEEMDVIEDDARACSGNIALLNQKTSVKPKKHHAFENEYENEFENKNRDQNHDAIPILIVLTRRVIGPCVGW